MLCKNCSAVFIDLDLPNRLSDAGHFKAKLKPADPGE
jgi:hypothetical protein